MTEMTALEKLGIRIDIEKVEGRADRLTEALNRVTAAAREAEEAFTSLQETIGNALILEQSTTFKAKE
jgi:hypothetical protein